MKRVYAYLNTASPYLFGAWVMLLCLLYALLALIRHNNFQSGAFDLGIFDQAIWQYGHGIYPYNTIKERFILGDHLTLTLPLFSILFYIWDNVRILLITQAMWVSVSAIAIYKIGRLRGFLPFVSLCIAFIYSLFYGIQFGIYFDWHPVIIGVGLLAWVAYFFEAKKKKLFWITLVVMLLTQENMGIGLACLGMYYFFQQQYRKQAIFMIIGGITVALAASKLIAALSPVGFQYQPVIPTNPITAFLDLFNSQEKKDVWVYTLGWYSFLPLFSPGALVAITADLAQYFVTGPEFARMWSPFMHHRAILAVFGVLGTLDVLGFLQKKKVPVVIIVMLLVFSALFQQYYYHFALNKLAKKDFWQQQSWMQDTQTLLATLPKDVPLAATQHIVPHVSHRKEIYLIWPRKKIGRDAQTYCGQQKECWWLDFGGKPQYLVVNVDDRQWITQLLESPQNFKEALRNMEKAGTITKAKQVNSAYLYRANY